MTEMTMEEFDTAIAAEQHKHAQLMRQARRLRDDALKADRALDVAADQFVRAGKRATLKDLVKQVSDADARTKLEASMAPAPKHASPLDAVAAAGRGGSADFGYSRSALKRAKPPSDE